MKGIQRKGRRGRRTGGEREGKVKLEGGWMDRQKAKKRRKQTCCEGGGKERGRS